MPIESYLSEPQENPKPQEPPFVRYLVKAAAHFDAQLATNHAINLGVTKCIQEGLKELSPIIDKLIAEEASALAHDHAPQFAQPRKTGSSYHR